MKLNYKTIMTLVGASLVCSASLQAATLITNGDFEAGTAANAPLADPYGDWNVTGTVYHDLSPGNGDIGTGQYVYVWAGGYSGIDQDVSTAWTTADTIDISMIAACFWNGNNQNVIVELRKASDNTVLWTDTFSDLSGTWNTIAAPGALDLSAYRSWSIDASTLAATEGEALNLNISWNGSGGQIDNVSLEVNPVPEPSSAALLGLGGLALILRRRK